MPLKGRQRHMRRLRKLSGREIAEVIGAGLYEAADLVRAKAFQSISAGSVSGKGHKPSKPGNPPLRDTGNLQSHLRIARTGRLKAEVRSEAAYSHALEFGSSKMAARPFLRPARDATRSELRNIVEKKIGHFLKRNRFR